MKKYNLKMLMFMALCCDIGLFSKRIIGPFSNIVTDSLHIPGGVGTSFSIMFVVIAAVLVDEVFSASLMSMIQCIIALALGMTGSMGALSIIGYIVPGMMIDLALFVGRSIKLSRQELCVICNALGSVTASLTANIIVFHLTGLPLALYVSVSLFSGMLCGLLADYLINRMNKVITFKKGVHYENK